VQITRIKPGGWIIILLLLAGIIFGVRACGHFAAGRPAAEAGSSSGADTPEAAAGGAKPKGKGPKPVKQAQQKKDDGASPAPAATPAPSPVSTRRAQLGTGH